MANDRWGNDDPYRTRRYGQDSDYERNFWREREARRRADPYQSSQYRGDEPRRDYGNDWDARSRSERSLWDRTKDEVRSWMGDTAAEHRREADHRGRGPRGYTRSDERIREDVSDRLMEDWQVDASDIEVSVASAEVTLSGTIDSREAKRRAENIAADVLGVKDVHNRLRAQPRSMYETTSGERTSTSAQPSTATGTTGQSTETRGTTPPSTPRH